MIDQKKNPLTYLHSRKFSIVDGQDSGSVQ